MLLTKDYSRTVWLNNVQWTPRRRLIWPDLEFNLQSIWLIQREFGIFLICFLCFFQDSRVRCQFHYPNHSGRATVGFFLRMFCLGLCLGRCTTHCVVLKARAAHPQEVATLKHFKLDDSNGSRVAVENSTRKVEVKSWNQEKSKFSQETFMTWNFLEGTLRFKSLEIFKLKAF